LDSFQLETSPAGSPTRIAPRQSISKTTSQADSPPDLLKFGDGVLVGSLLTRGHRRQHLLAKCGAVADLTLTKPALRCAAMKIAAAILLTLGLALTAHSKLVTEPVSYDHEGVKLEGYLAYDDQKTGTRRLPGVLIIPEWWGVNGYVKSRAEQIARLGYVAFVADMYGAGISTTDPKKAGELATPFFGKPLMANRARAGLNRLIQYAFVDAGRVAAIGYCFGGSTSQALAYSGAPLIGIVSFHGNLIPASANAALQNKARFLVCHGAVDPFIAKADLDAFLKSMDDGKFDYQFISYAHAVHAFTNPDADKAAAAGLQGVGYNAAADRRSWEHMKTFFNEIFAVSE
jgi:dienelactone hydrolase